MATPAAIISMLVQVKGVAGATSELRSLDSTARRTSAGMDDASKKSSRSSKAFAAIGSAARVAGPLIGAAGLAAGIKSAVGEFQEAQKVGANTRQVIKSTGGAANVTAKQIENLAGSISKKSGIDDEQIQKGANLLLTFKNIRNETGKGRDIFNQATQAATDLSAAGFGSLESTSKQLGKALNDPVKGMTALGRAGVTFLGPQKRAIEALMETGKASDRLKAQQIILKEVQSQVGGQAAAQATATDKLKVALGNLAEAAGSVLVPIFEKLATGLTSVINQFIEGKGIATVIIPVFNTLKGAIGGLVSVIAEVVNWLKQHQTVAMALGAFLATLALIYMASLVPAIIASTAALVANAAAWLVLNAAMLLNPFVLVAVALAALVAGIVIAYRESETFRAIVTTAWEAIKTATVTVWGFIKTYLLTLWSVLKAVITTYFEVYKFIITTAWTVVRTVTVAIWNAIRATLTAVWGAIRSVASTVWDAIATVILTYMRTVRDVLAAIWTAIRTVAVAAWGILRTAATTAWTGIRDVIVGPIRAAKELISDIWHAIGERATAAWNNIKSGLSQFATGVRDMIVDVFKDAAGKVLDFVNVIIDVINKIPGVEIDKVDAKRVGLAAGGTHVAGMARGGAFRKTGGFINRPMTFMGEEAPRHPEYVIPTNPAYRGRAQGLLGQAASAIGMAVGGTFMSSSYGPPWTAINGTGVTATGVDLRPAKQAYGVAVDPNVIALGSMLKINPNPHGTENKYKAFDTGGAIKGNRIDFYDWRGRAAQLGWGMRKVKVNGGGDPGSGSPLGNLVNKVGGTLGKLISGGAGFILDKLPGVGDLPGWLHNTGDWIIGKAKSYIKKKVEDLLSSQAASGGGGGGGQRIPPRGVRELVRADRRRRRPLQEGGLGSANAKRTEPNNSISDESKQTSDMLVEHAVQHLGVFDVAFPSKIQQNMTGDRQRRIVQQRNDSVGGSLRRIRRRRTVDRLHQPNVGVQR